MRTVQIEPGDRVVEVYGDPGLPEGAQGTVVRLLDEYEDGSGRPDHFAVVAFDLYGVWTGRVDNYASICQCGHIFSEHSEGTGRCFNLNQPRCQCAEFASANVRPDADL